ncbi:MAG TPA: hypothetical protein VMH87_12835 [Pseudomonadales bacterium]|nr:hypothetical protein [Pseudomonadales bacterium]
MLDVWKEKQAQNLTLSNSLKHHIEALNQRKDKLFEARFYEKAIDHETYQQQLDKLNARGDAGT